MGVPKIIRKNNHRYIFVKQCNKNMFLYEEEKLKYKVCFTRFDLGMIKEVIPASTHVNPENVKI